MLRLIRIGRAAAALAVLGGLVACSNVPVVEGISPKTGPEVGGTVVTITGKNFKKGATVTVNSQAVSGSKVVSATEIQVTMPAGEIGVATVNVVNPQAVPSETPATFEYTDSTPPVAELVEPSGEFAHDAVPASVRVQFSEPIRAGSVVVTDEAANNIEGATAVEENALVFTPTAPFAPGHQYAISVAGVYDNADNESAGTSGAFSITAAPAKKAPARKRK